MIAEHRIRVALQMAASKIVHARLALGMSVANEIGALEQAIQAEIVNLLELADTAEYPEFCLETVAASEFSYIAKEK